MPSCNIVAEPYSGRSSPPCRVRPNTRAIADAHHAPLNGRLLDYCMARKRRRALFSVNRDQPHDDLTEEELDTSWRTISRTRPFVEWDVTDMKPLRLTGFDCHFCSILDLELLHYIVQMDLNRAFADIQLMSDNFVGLALPDSIHDGTLLLS